MDRAWMVVLSSMALLFMTLGFVYSFGELYNPIIDEFNTTISFVASVGALQQSLTYFMAPVGSLMLDHIGHRTTVIVGLILSITGLVASSFVHYLQLLYVTLGLFGTGAGLIVNTCINIVGMYFSTGNSSRAFAIMSAGIPTGTFALNLLGSYVYDVYGWRKSLLMITGIYATVSAISLVSFTPSMSVVWVSLPASRNENNGLLKLDFQKYLRIFRYPKFVLYEVAVVLLAFSISFHYIDFVSVIDTILQGNGSGTVAVSILSLSDLIALISLACLGNSLPSVRRNILPFVLLILNVPSTILFAFSIETHTIYTAAALSGVARGILLAAPLSLVLEIFGAQRGNECLTHTILAIGIGSLTGPVTLSCLSERFSYTIEFLACAVTSSVAAILFMIESCLTMDEPIQCQSTSAYGAIHT